MKLTRKDRLFLILCAVLLVFAALFVLFGTRENLPQNDQYSFPISFTYERNGVPHTETATYLCDYTGRNWIGYFEISGDCYAVYNEEPSGEVWTIALELEGGYLAGDPDFADLYADGLPRPTLSYYDFDTEEDCAGLDRIDKFGVVLTGCTVPPPVKTEWVRDSLRVDEADCVWLAVFAAALLAACLLLVHRTHAIRPEDRLQRVFGLLLALVAAPFLTLVCCSWSGPSDDLSTTLIRLIPALTLLAVCAGVFLRRKGFSRAAAAVQFTGPALFMLLMIVLMSLDGDIHMLMLPAGVIAGALTALLSRRKEGVVPGRTDRISAAAGILLVPVYTVLSMVMVFMASLAKPSGSAAWAPFAVRVLSLLIASAPVFCGVFLGLSAAYRKKGRSRAALLIQFAGFASLALSLLLLCLTEFLPWISVTIN